MNKEEYIGKWYLGAGDLKPMQVDKHTSEQFCEHLDGRCLLFDSEEQAEVASINAVMLIESIKNCKCVREEDLIEVDIRPRVYLSGPISGYDIEERRQAFQRAKHTLEMAGYDVFNPMENGLPDNAKTREHMRCDIEQLLSCDKIFMMERWTHSKGCKVEFDVATSIGLPVIFQELFTYVEFK